MGGLQLSPSGRSRELEGSGSQRTSGIGGAMDIAAGAKHLIVTMEHTTKGRTKDREALRSPSAGWSV